MSGHRNDPILAYIGGMSVICRVRSYQVKSIWDTRNDLNRVHKWAKSGHVGSQKWPNIESYRLYIGWYRELSGYIVWCRVFLFFIWPISGHVGSCRVFEVFIGTQIGSNRVLSGLVGPYRVMAGFNTFCWVYIGCSRVLDRVLSGVNDRVIYRVSSGYIGLDRPYRVWSGAFLVHWGLWRK